ncbi:MAG: hypothetical protein HUJ26_07520 [Planctomycetaceae bacterium]|nr:hypothetical protein [Planctomycetaceae bacterium]
MVRETRFSFDQNSPHRHDPPPDDFTEEDDLFLDAFSQPTARDSSARNQRKRVRPKKSDRGESSNARSSSSVESTDGERRGHLADADWLNPPQSPRQRSSRKSA